MSRKKLFLIMLVLFATGMMWLGKPLLAESDPYSPSRLGVGGRALGMGGAFVAISDDVSAVYWNPAGLGWVRDLQLAGMHSDNYLFDVKYDWLGYAHSMDELGTLGASFYSTKISGIPFTELDSLGHPMVKGYYEDSEYTGSLSYGYPINMRLAGGFTIKNIQRKLAWEEGNGWGLDLGIMYRPTPYLSLGACLQNLMDTEIQWSTGHKDEREMVAKLGVAGSFLDKSMYVALDADLVKNRPVEWHFGLEYWFYKMLGFRVGSDDGNLTGGVSYKRKSWQVDYAYLSHEIGDTHRISAKIYIDILNKSRSRNRTKRSKDVDKDMKNYNTKGVYTSNDVKTLERRKNRERDEKRKLLQRRRAELTKEKNVKSALENSEIFKDQFEIPNDFINDPEEKKSNQSTSQANVKRAESALPPDELCKTELEFLAKSVSEYNEKSEFVATSLKDLEGTYIEKVMKDPWGKEYKLDILNDYVRSAGADGSFNTKDDVTVSAK